jgi:MFS family permease
MRRGALRQVFGIPEFRIMWVADLLSIAGDQLARVALAVLVFGRTGSALWAATTYALTFVPALLGGVFLAGFADRYRRREVMIASDLLRAVGVAAMAIQQLPLWALCIILVGVVLLGAPHTAAQGALMPDLLRGELYERGLAVRQMTNQTAQLAGFAGGGVLVAAMSPGAALIADAVTFAVSAVLLRAGLSDRPRPSGASAEAGDLGPRGIVAGIIDIVTDPRRRVLVFLALLVGCYVVPEGLAAPFAGQIGAGPAAVGLLMAADPLGSVFGAWVFVRYMTAETRERLVGAGAVCGGLPLVAMVFRPGLPVALALWAVSGMFSTAYLLQTQASFVRATPDDRRGRAIGVAASGIVASQGVAVFVGGALADAWSPSLAVAMSGATGAAFALAAAVVWRRVNRRTVARDDAEGAVFPTRRAA